MQQANFSKSLSPSKHLFPIAHKSAKKFPNPTLLSNKLKINFPFLSPLSHLKKHEQWEQKFWTSRGKKCKTEEVSREGSRENNEILKNNEKDRSKKTVEEERMDIVGKQRINQFLIESPERKLIRFEEQTYQRQSQKLKRQLRNLEQIQSKLFHRIQSLNYEQGSTQLKNKTAIPSSDFLPSLKTTEKKIKMKKGEEKAVLGLNEMMITFSPTKGKQWNRRDAPKSERD